MSDSKWFATGDIRTLTNIATVASKGKTSRKKIVAYAGLDASVNESSNFIGTENKISKRASTEPRNAFIASRTDPVLSEYYHSLRERGKPHRVSCTCYCSP